MAAIVQTERQVSEDIALPSLTLASCSPSERGLAPRSDAPVLEFFISLRCGDETKKVLWQSSSSLEDLVRVYIREFEERQSWFHPSLTENLKAAIIRRAFHLRDAEYGICYEGFDATDITEGSYIQVASGALRTSLTEVKGSPEYNRKTAWDESKTDQIGAQGQRSKTEAFRQKIWNTVDDPDSSRLAAAITAASLILILFSTTTFCIETLPGLYVHEVSTNSWWYISEAVCIACFTLEAVLRMASCPDKRAYFEDFMNLVDIVAILPFYLELMLNGLEIPGFAVFRVVRLVRVFRLIKVSRGSITVFAVTMRESLRPLYMLVALTSIAMIVFSSLMYYAERGRWNETLRVWERIEQWDCEITITRDNAIPEDYVLKTSLTEGSRCTRKFDVEGLSKNEASFICPFPYAKSTSCTAVYFQSPFESIPAAMPFVLQTMTTVGYGDLYPVTPFGKLLGAVVMLFGMLVIALPITVIGSNFSMVYNSAVVKKDMEEEQGSLDVSLSYSFWRSCCSRLFLHEG
ncbi:hypothetical protein CYMTET_27068 [Cymbomonas tetramitiformis]|uniref:Ion transport domain-containing protein n=1 Tax=Cymbomonas tetramitiformis TaxID=36881 RepID=A0AAE0FQT7_9CHLO|nr:hypothetical protein CYMTET_27068 [Cymbomonas tetramitiformis]